VEHIRIFIQLTRLNRPIGYMLLFWPCAWGIALASHYNNDSNLIGYYLMLFFLGSVLMRSAGCIFNDIIDRDVDAKVKRTRSRPLAAKKISVTQSFIYVIILCLVALTVLLQFNMLTIILGLSSMLFAFSYPFMKRLTYWPQLFLGVTFSWGAVMAWTSLLNSFSHEIFILYAAAIFWTLGYDTIYGLQDIIDDEIIGMKSTSIKFKNKIKTFVFFCYLSVSILLSYLIFKHQDNIIASFVFLLFVISLFNQILEFNPKIPKTCLKGFKSNNFSGFLMFISLMLISI
jgi:4-hydroxybenzoate polyprenyltransferase